MSRSSRLPLFAAIAATWLAGLVLVCLATIPFAGSVSDRRLWDDPHYVFDNPTLADRSHGLARIWAGEYLMDYYPVPQTILWVEYGLFGDHAVGYRVANILLHAAGGLLVWWAAAQWRLPWPWLLATIWACHPTNCDAVCWIAQHKSTVATIFFALAAGLYRRSAACGPLAVLAHGLACLSKTDAVMLPVLLVALEGWRAAPGTDVRAWARTVAGRILPFAGVSLVAALGAARFMATRVVTTPIDLGTPVERLLKSGWAICFYLCDVVWPLRLAAAYPLPSLQAGDPGSWWPLLMVVAAVAAMGFLWWHRPQIGRPLLLAGIVFIVMLLPVLMIFPQGYFRYSLVADRYLHLPLLAAAAIVSGALHRAARHSGWPGTGRQAAGALAGAIVLTLGTITALHAPTYRSEESLWRTAIAAQPQAWFPYHGLGTALLNEGNDPMAAIPFLERAARMHGTYPVTWFNLGLALSEVGRLGDGRAMLVRALELEPRFKMARLALEELDRRQPQSEGRGARATE